MKITKNNIKKTKGAYKPKAMVIMIDEMTEVLSGSNYKLVSNIQDNIGSIARLGRAAGTHLVLATQRPSSNVINADLKNNIQQSVLLGDFDSGISSLVFDEDIAHLSKPEIKGRGFVKAGKDKYEFQSYWTEPKRDFKYNEVVKSQETDKKEDIKENEELESELDALENKMQNKSDSSNLSATTEKLPRIKERPRRKDRLSKYLEEEELEDIEFLESSEDFKSTSSINVSNEITEEDLERLKRYEESGMFNDNNDDEDEEEFDDEGMFDDDSDDDEFYDKTVRRTTKLDSEFLEGANKKSDFVEEHYYPEETLNNDDNNSDNINLNLNFNSSQVLSETKTAPKLKLSLKQNNLVNTNSSSEESKPKLNLNFKKPNINS